MYAVSTASIPPILRYVCPYCGYASEPIKTRFDAIPLPLELRKNKEESKWVREDE
jgi:hypothetical protein